MKMDKAKLKELRNIQEDIAKRVILYNIFDKIETIAGFDASYKGKTAKCACVVMRGSETIEEKIVKEPVSFPYIPTFLSFREGPIMIRAYRELENKPDLLLIDGNGILHPLRSGLATHIGVVLKKPSIGIAKRLLLGRHKKLKNVGDCEDIHVSRHVLGSALLTKENCNPIYISVGHGIYLERAVKIVKSLVRDKIQQISWFPKHYHTIL